MLSSRLPCLFVSHGGGPLFFIDSATVPALMRPLARDGEVHRALMRVPKQLRLSRPPRAIVVISAHWQTKDAVAVSTVGGHRLLYDYGRFPPHTFQLKYDAPADQTLSNDIVRRLNDAGQPANLDNTRGFDHGVFVPLLVLFPEANIPVVAMSILSGYNPERHIEIGKALSALRDDNVLIIGSGFVTHERDATMRQTSDFVSALGRALTAASAEERTKSLINWRALPSANAAHRFGHEDHLIPLHVIAGAAGSDSATELSALVFGGDESAMAAANYAFGINNTTEAQRRDEL